MNEEYEVSDAKLTKLNHRLHTVNTRLQEGFKRRIESLNTKNTKTQEIKVKMEHEERVCCHCLIYRIRKRKGFWSIATDRMSL